MNAGHRTLAALLAIGILAACSGGRTSPVAPVVPTATGTPAANAGAVAYSAGLLSGATYVSRAQLASVGFDVLLTMRDMPGLIAYARNANDRGSALYRHWLTPQELGDRFGASVTDYGAAEKYLAANGIAYKAYPQRQILRIAGPQANVERAFGLQFGFFHKDGETFLAPISAPKPAAVLHVAALGNVIRYRVKRRRILPLRLANSFLQGYSPEQIANAFDYTGAYAAGYKGDGITIGIIGTGAITDGDPRIAGGDVAEYRVLYGVSGTGVVKQDVDTSNYSMGNTDGGAGDQYSQSGLQTPPPVTSPIAPACQSQGYNPSDPNSYDSITDFSTCNPEDLESQTDTEQASALAPNATVNFYIAYNPNECYGTCTASNTPSQELGLNESDDEIEQAIADNASDVISMSFGLDEADSETIPGYFGPNTNNFGPMEFASLAAEGVAIFASSGDNGAEECSNGNTNKPCVIYPATDPSVISVGGVNLPLDNSGRLTGPITGWGTQTQIPGFEPGGSGGGCSIYFTEPSFASAVTPCGGGFRSQPDVALDADLNTGVAVVLNAAPSLGGRVIEDVGGTSVSSPEMAAMWALVLEACDTTPSCVAHGTGSKPYRLGNPGTYLYEIYGNPAQYAASFYDVLFGNNALPGTGGTLDPGFSAGKGYDLVTGIGAPYAKNLITSVLADVP